MAPVLSSTCKNAKCKQSPNTELEDCCVDECSNKIHHICYKGVLLQKKADVIMITDDIEGVVCSKRCYNKLVSMKKKAAVKPTSKRTAWDKDGPTEDVSSHSIIIDWLMTPGNYHRWRGDKKEGKTKVALSKDISFILKSKGIIVERKPHQIMVQIGLYEKKFKAATDWMSNTGAGVKETDPRSFDAYVQKLCPFCIFSFVRP